jgi:hypothetical protein
VTGVLLFVLGYVAYSFRTKKRAHYGAFEVGAAMAVAYATLEHPRDAVFQTTSLVGVLYFLVRGLDNVTIGAAQEIAAFDARVKADEQQGEAAINVLNALSHRGKDFDSRVNTAFEEKDRLQSESAELRREFDAFRREVANSLPRKGGSST